MRLHSLVTVFAISAGVFAPACMTSSPQPDHESVAESTAALANAPSVSTGVRCSDESWQDIFWAEPEMITPVGYLTCTCFQLEDLTGEISPYISLAYEFQCEGCTGSFCQ